MHSSRHRRFIYEFHFWSCSSSCGEIEQILVTIWEEERRNREKELRFGGFVVDGMDGARLDAAKC